VKIRPVGTELFHAGRRTDGHDKGCSRFSQFMKLALNRGQRLLRSMAEDKRVSKFRMWPRTRNLEFAFLEYVKIT